MQSPILCFQPMPQFVPQMCQTSQQSRLLTGEDRLVYGHVKSTGHSDVRDNQKKIGILTFHRCINYGSYWQARSLTEALRSRGFGAELLEHWSPRINHVEWQCALQPVLPTPTPNSDYPLYALKMLKFHQAFAALPTSPAFSLENPADMEAYDLIIVGSDEVWNLYHPWYGQYPLFFGDGLRTNRLAAYAASFGNYPASHKLDRIWADKLQRFQSISVRDENSRQIISDALGRDPEIVLDPCLLFPPRAHVSPTGQLHPYIALYGHNFSPPFSHAIQHWAKLHDHRIVSIGYRNDWADEQWITAGPEEFAHFMAHAGAVATNFFHGCVFALLNTKPFVCELSDYRSNKICELMNTIGGQRHLVSENTPVSEVDALLSESFSCKIGQRINTLRDSSNRYLDRVLGWCDGT